MTTHHQILQGDCLKLLETLSSESIDLVVTDPPYLCSYRERGGRTVANDDAPERVLGAFEKLYRLLKPNTVCISFYGWGHVDKFFHAWNDAGFRPIGHLVWPKSYISSRGFVNARHEQAYILAKGRPAKPICPLDDVQPWKYTGNRSHPTEKAVSIIKPLVETFSVPGNAILDPFAGSGSTLVAAAMTGRRALGIELEPNYCELARKRLDGIERYQTSPPT